MPSLSEPTTARRGPARGGYLMAGAAQTDTGATGATDSTGATGSTGSTGTTGTIAVPSGQPVALAETLWPAPEAEPGERILRLRFLAPHLAAGGIDAAEDDMEALCRTVALPMLAEDPRAVDEIVISLMARFVAFGASAPDVRQVFDAYRPVDGGCEWQGL